MLYLILQETPIEEVLFRFCIIMSHGGLWNCTGDASDGVDDDDDDGEDHLFYMQLQNLACSTGSRSCGCDGCKT